MRFSLEKSKKLFKVLERVSYVREYLVAEESLEEAFKAVKENRADLVKEEYEDGNIIGAEEI